MFTIYIVYEILLYDTHILIFKLNVKILYYFHLILHSLILLLEIFLFFNLIFSIKNVEFIYLNIKSKNRKLEILNIFINL